jgi:hypothetical protein
MTTTQSPLTQPSRATSSGGQPRRGNPTKRARGQIVRGLLLAKLSQGVVSLEELCALLQIKHAGLCNHLSAMRDRRLIKGYTTAGGRVHAWWN